VSYSPSSRLSEIYGDEIGGDDQQQYYHVLWKILHGQGQGHDGLMAVIVGGGWPFSCPFPWDGDDLFLPGRRRRLSTGLSSADSFGTQPCNR
jgi:hypothetical protein